MADTEVENLKRARTPVEVYRFWNKYDEQRVTSFDEEITFQGKVYKPAVVNRQGTQATPDNNVSTVKIDLDYLNPDIIYALGAAPLTITYVQITKIFRGDKKKLQGIVYFIGVMGPVNIQGVKANVTCYGIERLLRVVCPKWRYTPLCVHQVYDTGCGLDKKDFIVSAYPTANTGLTQFTAAAYGVYATNYFQLGHTEHFKSEPVMVVAHSGNTITTRFPVRNFEAGQELRVVPGCGKTMEECTSKFNNHLNAEYYRYLGFPHIPMDNPAQWVMS